MASAGSFFMGAEARIDSDDLEELKQACSLDFCILHGTLVPSLRIDYTGLAFARDGWLNLLTRYSMLEANCARSLI